MGLGTWVEAVPAMVWLMLLMVIGVGLSMIVGVASQSLLIVI
jgi:hypothetical protein